MKNPIGITVFLFLSSFLAAGNEGLSSVSSVIPKGSYSLVKGDKHKCPDGQLNYSEKSNRLILGTNISFDLSQFGKLSIEKVPGGCLYEGITSFKNGSLNHVIKTKSCPSKSEEGVIVHKLSFEEKKLQFSSIKNDIAVVSCQYTYTVAGK